MKNFIALLVAFSAISAHASLTLETKFNAKITMDGTTFSKVRVFATYNESNPKDCKLKIGNEDILSLFTPATEVNCAYIEATNTILFEESALREIANRSQLFSCAAPLLKSAETCADFSNTADQGIINKSNSSNSITGLVKSILGAASGIRTITTNSHSSFDLNSDSNRITIDLTPVKTKIVID